MDKFLNCLSKFVTSKLGKPFMFRVNNNLLRNLSEKKGKGICPQCLAGLDDVPYEDFSWSPLWKPTVGLTHPWPVDDPSPLLQIPGLGVNQQDLFRKDPFHIFKQTVGGHWVASTIVLLLDLGYWSRPGQSNQADTLLEFAYEDFNHFVKKEWTGHNVANIKHFTKALLHWPKVKSFPYGRFKGGDCMLMIRWLARLMQKGRFLQDDSKREGASLIDNPIENWHTPFLKNILQGCNSSLMFFHILHTQGVWLTRVSAHSLSLECWKFLKSYSSLAQLCHLRQLRRYMLEPSLHYFHHFAVDTNERLSLQDKYVLSPNQDNCEADEDFVGRIARLSRAVHATTVTQRTLQRYRIKVWFVLNGQDWGMASGTKRKRLRTGGNKSKKRKT